MGPGRLIILGARTVRLHVTAALLRLCSMRNTASNIRAYPSCESEMARENWRWSSIWRTDSWFLNVSDL